MVTRPDSNQAGLWTSGLSEELHFWESVFAPGNEQWREELTQRLDPQSPLKRGQRRFLTPRETVEILDVGAGPLTCLGKMHEQCAVRITAVDPLADDYDRILAKSNITPPVRTQRGQAEHLARDLGENRFDLVFSQNAMDHAADPMVGIRQCLLVARPECYVVLMNFLNEAKAQNYQGLHQWNFDRRSDRFVIWNRENEIDVQSRVDDLCDQIICESPRPGFLTVALRKRKHS